MDFSGIGRAVEQHCRLGTDELGKSGRAQDRQGLLRERNGGRRRGALHGH